MKAIILAAGEGKRMRPLTLETPKPLLKVKDKPIINYVLDALPKEIDEIIVVVKYLGDKIVDQLGKERKGVKVKYVLGSDEGNAYSFLATRGLLKNERFLLIYGDEIPTRENVKRCLKEDLSILVFGDDIYDGVMVLNTDIFEYKPTDNLFKILVEQFVEDHDVTLVKAKNFVGGINTPGDLVRVETSTGYKNELERLALKYGTDKCPDIGHSYTDFYYHLFADKRDSIRKLLEIGVGYKNNCPYYAPGGSLRMWRDFFPNAQIYGIDIRKDLVFKKKRIQTFLCPQADSAGLVKLIEEIGNDIDIVIDDGSHRSKDIITSFLTLMPLLQKNVTYVIEDVNRRKVAIIIENLKGYNYHIMRRSRMLSSDDRLIVVTNKNG